VLTAYVLAIAHEAGWAMPPDVAERLLGALRGFVEGKVRSRFALPTTDLSIRKVAALEALARYGKAEASQLGAVAVEPALWPTSAVLDWWSLLARLPDAPNRARRMAEAEQVVRTRLTVRGTTLGFSTEGRDGLWWLMATPDVNAARLVLLRLGMGAPSGSGSVAPGGTGGAGAPSGPALGSTAGRPAPGVTGGDLLDDVPRLVRGALARQRRGAWDTTVANAWGALAMARFSRAFEKDAVQGVTSATLGGESRQLDWAGGPAGGTLGFPAPAGDGEVSVDHQGQGHPWVTVAVRAAVPLAAPVASGYRVTKTVTPLEPRPGGGLRTGDLLRVRLEIDAQADMTWVVVDDPIPAGASHVGTGLGRDSEIATRGEAWRGRAWPAYQERGFESFRAYYTLVPKGTFVVEYTLRLGPSGRFLVPSTRVEALYAPDVYGETPNAPVVVMP
jgi:hypothetical protein